MAIHTENSRLTLLGDFSLGSIASVVANGLVHPISTIQSRAMAEHPSNSAINLSHLFYGFRAICLTDALAFGIAVATNNIFQEHLPLWAAATLAGLISTPVVSIGEGMARNRQVHALSYKETFIRSLRFSGFIATGMREVPFTVGVFYLPPLVQKRIFPNGKDTPLEKTTSAGLSGALSGFITNPFELIKTRVQTSKENLSIRATVRNVLKEEGAVGFFRSAHLRMLYVGGVGSVVVLLGNTVPEYLPKALHVESY